MSALVKELGLNTSKADENGHVDSNNTNKRKRSTSDDDDIEDSEDDDDDDEEIFSDTDEEMKANEAKQAKKLKKAAGFVFTELKPDQFEEYLAKFNREYLKYR